MTFTLFDYYRSSASYRVRIALNLKGLEFNQVNVDLLKDAHNEPDYKVINPQGLVPALEISGSVISQSLAIIEYLDETNPEPPLLPPDPLEKAQHRAMALALIADTHPVQNLRVVKYVETLMPHQEGVRDKWMVHFIQKGLEGFQGLLLRQPHAPFASGNNPGLVDCCLVPQLYNARRWGVDLAGYPHLIEIENNCLALPAFKNAAPEMQVDAKS